MSEPREPENLSEGVLSTPPDPAAGSNGPSVDKGVPATPAHSAHSAHHLRAGRPPRPREKDYSIPLVALTLCFLALAAACFVWTDLKTSRPIHTITVTPEEPLLPVPELVSANATRDLGGGRWELGYDFAARAGDRPALLKTMKDWKGPLNTGQAHRAHKPFFLDGKTGLPKTPLFSQVSFEKDLEIRVDVEKLRPAWFYIFFYYFYEHENTGTALRISPKGVAQFVRYRRTLLVDDPRGVPGTIKFALRKKVTLRIKVTAFRDQAGYRVSAYQDGRAVTAAEYPPEWPEDRRYTPGESVRTLVSDYPIPPQSGFLALASSPMQAVLIHKIVLRGTVAKLWLQQRTEFREMIEKDEPGTRTPAPSEVVRPAGKTKTSGAASALGPKPPPMKKSSAAP